MSEAKKAPKKVSKQEFSRKMKGEQVIFHDLYRLEEGVTLKDVGWNPQAPLIERFNHKHFFHTVDSDGKEQTHCTPSLGHTHEVKIIGHDESGEPIIEVGPAVVITKSRGQKKVFPYKYDQHKHKATYLYSEELKVRKYSEEALVQISKIKAHEEAMAKSPTE